MVLPQPLTRTMSLDQDPWATPAPRQGGLRNRLKKLVHKRKSLPASPEYALPLSQPSPPLPSLTPAGLTVQLNIRYRSPLNINFENIYETSRNHVPSDDECHGLLRRLDHGCPELITRRDSAAASSHRGDKVMRFELTFTVSRNGTPWAVKVYTSYQELPLDRQSAIEVAEAADRLVGPYLKAHDKAFRWQPCERLSVRPETAIPPQGSTVSLASVPQGRFITSMQEYESIPGYEISLVFTSQRRPRKPVVWERRVHIRSNQTTPLTLSLGEDLTWKISSAVNNLLDARRSIKPGHKPSDDSDSDDTRAHLDDDSLHVGFRISNRIGFDFGHLERSTDSKLALFRHPEGLDCQEFVQELERAITTARDEIDSTLGSSDDLKISVRQLSGLAGTYWTVKNPFAVSLDSSVCYNRDTIQAVLERVQTGISDVLSGNDVSITFAATKRGHVVLDKTLVAQAVRSKPRRPASNASDGPNQDALLLALKERMQIDVSMVVRDTCSLVYSAEAPPNLRLIERRFDIPLPSPSTLVAESHYEPTEPENSLSVDDVISASMAKFVAINDDSIDSSSETTSKYQPDPETPHRPIPFLKDQQQGISTSCDSPETTTYSATDAGDSTSTRLSTPCLSDKDTETPQESVATTPNQYQGQYTFERLVRGDDCTTHEQDEMKLPRRFALLSRNRRPKTPVVEAKTVEQPVIIDEKAAKKKNDAIAVENIEAPVAKADDTAAPAAAPAEPEEPAAAEPAKSELKTKIEEEKPAAQVAADLEGVTVIAPVEETTSVPQEEVVNVETKELSAVAESQVAPIELPAAVPAVAETSSSQTDDAAVASPEAVEAHIVEPADAPNDTVVEPLAESDEEDVGDSTVIQHLPSSGMEGFLQYSALSPTSDTSPEGATEQETRRLEDDEVASDVKPDDTIETVPSVEASKADALSDEVEHIQRTVEDTQPRTPEPKTPQMSAADSTAGDSCNDDPLIPFPDLDRAPPSPALSTSSLTLWRPLNTFIPEDPEDLDLDDTDSPSKNARPSLYPRPSTPHANSYFSAPQNVSPTASPSPALPRPYLGMHKRQFSSPTAGYLGLLHGRGSPLRMQSYTSGIGLDRATEEEEEGSYSPVVAMQRRSSWALVALRSGPEVDLAARPSSSAGFPRPGDPPGLRGRSSSTLSASIWLTSMGN
ncbi:hypothetical protein B0T11DRAFT_19121 [Plectosphaerella cucumerina]|uniref:Uncharacterized protein n=1 Tax=Plectosphaerella cucumerina TaxID=40658 RepID=A0A8K0TPZ8_9PEZI|nr:hypothetical protein B0T11DRAFT_19121 [Plectosphaerella cucumerina]